MPVHAASAPWLRTVLPIAIIAVVIAIRLWRMRGVRRLRLETLWIMPALFVAIAGFTFAASPPGPAGWGWAALALAAGAAIGWYRGKMMRIAVDPATHVLNQQASPAAALLLVALLVIKQAAQAEYGGFDGAGHGATLATDIAMAFALGLIAATRLEMTLRARRLLAAARSPI